MPESGTPLAHNGTLRLRSFRSRNVTMPLPSFWGIAIRFQTICHEQRRCHDYVQQTAAALEAGYPGRHAQRP